MKNVKSVVCAGVCAVGTAAAACTGIYVGRGVSADGTTIIARTVDSTVGRCKRFDIQPRVEDAPGRHYLGNDMNPNRLIDFDNFKTKYDTLYISGYTVSTPNPSQTTAQPQQPQQPKKPATSAQYYKVRKGDNLGKIAAKYHTTVSKIKKLNHLRSDFIREGQRLRVR